MNEWIKRHPLTVRVLIYGAAAMLAFAVAAGVGATIALMLQGDLGIPAKEEPRSSGQQGNTPQHQQAAADRSQQEKAGAEREQAASQQEETTYVHGVGEIQANSVETFLASHEKLLRYDALTAHDVEEMQANQAALQKFADQAGDLNAPQKYREQNEVFLSAIDELHEAAQLAYALAADPTSATQSGFEEYDSHVEKAAALLQRSNETLDRDYKTIEDVQGVSPS